MTSQIRSGIAGYGNLGRGVQAAIAKNPEMELVGVYTRRDPQDLQLASPAPRFSITELEQHTDQIDVLILCGGSKSDLPDQGPQYEAPFLLEALRSQADARGLIDWEVSVDPTINRAHQHGTNLTRTTGGLVELQESADRARRPRRGPFPRWPEHEDPCPGRRQPPPLVLMLGPGQAGDAPMFPNLMDSVKVEKQGSGAARKRPTAALADKAYSSKAIRTYLRDRGIKCVIPERSDQIANQKRKGSAGGRPVSYDKQAYKRRHVVECSFNTLKQWRALATRYDKLALTYRAAVAMHAVMVRRSASSA